MKPSSPLNETLLQLSLFKKLNEYSPLSYKTLVKQLTFRSFTRGELIFKESEPCSIFYIALSGKLALLFPKPADQLAKEIKLIQSRSHLISKTKAIMRVQSAFKPTRKGEITNNDHFPTQPQPHKSTFKSKATSILRIQTAFSSNNKDATRNPITPDLPYPRTAELEVKHPLTSLLKGKEPRTNFFSTHFMKNKQEKDEELMVRGNNRNFINPFLLNSANDTGSSGSLGLGSAGGKGNNVVLNIAGLGEEVLGGALFQEGVCKYILIKILKKAGDLLQNLDDESDHTNCCIGLEEGMIVGIEWSSARDIFSEMHKLKKLKSINFFRENFFWNTLARRTVYKSLSLFEKRKARKMSCIFSQNEPVDFIFLIKKGEIELLQENQVVNGKEEKVRLTLLSKGCIFGEEEVLELANRRFTAVVHQNCVYYALNLQILRSLMEEHSDWADEMREACLKKNEFYINSLKNLKNKLKNFGEKNKKRYECVRATAEDINRIYRICSEPDKDEKEIHDKNFKIKVKSYENENKLCFFRGKREACLKTEPARNYYEIDDSEKKVSDRGKVTNYLLDLVKNNMFCLRMLISKSTKMNRTEILNIFDKDKFILSENRKNIKKKIQERRSHMRIMSATFKTKTLGSEFNLNEKKINFHMRKRPQSSIKNANFAKSTGVKRERLLSAGSEGTLCGKKIDFNIKKKVI